MLLQYSHRFVVVLVFPGGAGSRGPQRSSCGLGVWWEVPVSIRIWQVLKTKPFLIVCSSWLLSYFNLRFSSLSSIDQSNPSSCPLFYCYFSRSERVLYLFSADSLSSGPIANAGLNVSPSTLIPFYDPDTSVVILTGKVSKMRDELVLVASDCVMAKVNYVFCFSSGWHQSLHLWVGSRRSILYWMQQF